MNCSNTIYMDIYNIHAFPLNETHLVVFGGLSSKKFDPSASMRRAQLNVPATTVRSTNFLICNTKT